MGYPMKEKEVFTVCWGPQNLISREYKIEVW